MEPSKWRHVISEPNPADYASRGIKASETKKLEKWNNGAVLQCCFTLCWLNLYQSETQANIKGNVQGCN